ncbi:magnesium transporter [Halobacillus litoralis]|uniref:Magnesium transporter MgtE n=1 Tax=Halobacillus litoralis TaxID=45668 RepID=A0A845F7Y1_9BACI|nr:MULTISPECIES: magnesium transporter [Halobacillus]MBN9653909.1 magnesium transporter [Halobacillus sp. GSS1]MEC3883444.1 magnesium transporter [Halobacillus sp. HZG1]MYL70293.1 magnesium transporter [Halobacillus litoralis]
MEHLDDQERQEVWTNIKDALFNDHIDQFRAEFLELHPYDQARIFEDLDKEIRMQIYTYLSPEEVADVMEHIDYDEIEPFFTEMDPTFAAQVFAEMSTDDAVDILNELDKDKVASFLTIMDDDAADEIKDLLHYEEKTAGSIMTTEFVVVKAGMTIKEAMVHLRTEAPDAETIYYTYVINEDKRLVGVISLRDLIISEEEWLISDVMNERVVSVSVGEDQEEVARMVRDYDFLALPVVDFQDHLLGIITVDDIMDVMEEEASDDYSKLAAVSDVDSPDDNAFASAKKRLPWLVILLFLGSLTASLIGRFEDTLDQVAILAIFIPLIAGMAGNTGTQALAVAVRGIATGEIEKQGKWKMMMREAGTGIITGLSCGVLITLIVYIWHENFYLGALVGLSIFMTLVVATLAGSLVPLLMHRLKIDPAVASGPFITTVNDLISILIYFGLATAFMNLLI